MTGRAIFKYYDGSVYEGDFEKGILTSEEGKWEWADGTNYKGMWVDGYMHGQGRFLSATGEFWEGQFHRNCFHKHDGSWIDLSARHQASEMASLAKGDAAHVPIVRVSNALQLNEELARITRHDNMVPFVVADTSCLPEDATVLDWVEGTDQDTTVFLKFVAIQKQRHHDYRSRFYNGIQKALVAGKRFSVVFEPDEEDPEAGVPQSQALQEFFDRFAFPLEAFDPRLFHGRQYPVSFLPEDRRQEYFLVAPPPPPPSVAASPEPPAEGEEAPPAAAAPATREPPVLYRLDFMVTTQGRLSNGASDKEVREMMIKSYGHLAPLHRTTVVLVTSG